MPGLPRVQLSYEYTDHQQLDNLNKVLETEGKDINVTVVGAEKINVRLMADLPCLPLGCQSRHDISRYYLIVLRLQLKKTLDKIKFRFFLHSKVFIASLFNKMTHMIQFWSWWTINSEIVAQILSCTI